MDSPRSSHACLPRIVTLQPAPYHVSAGPRLLPASAGPPDRAVHTCWAKVAAELVWDGSLRDLYVFEASESDWDAFLSALPSWPYETSFLVDGEPAELPRSALD